jgi:NADPH:quinone reductase-like Zn-dependent oxidoreductase
MKLPDGMSFEEGASIGSGIGTIGLALFRSLEVPGYPEEPAITPKYVLVYGGSSATGTMAIQLLKLYRDPEIYPKKIQPLTYSKDAD